MAYAPPPPLPPTGPNKRPYPEQWAQPGYLATQDEWAPPRKESRPQGWEGYDSKPARFEESHMGYPVPNMGYPVPNSMNPPGPPIKHAHPATSTTNSYNAWAAGGGYHQGSAGEGYSPNMPSWDNYPPYYPQRPQATKGYPQRPPEGYPVRPPDNYPQRPPEGYPQRPPANEDYSRWPPAGEGYPPRPYPQGEYPFRPPTREDFPPMAPPRGDMPRPPPGEDYAPRAPQREDFPPRAPPHDYPPRAPPREDFPPVGPPREDNPQRPSWDEYADPRSRREHDQRRNNEASRDWEQFENGSEMPRGDGDSGGRGRGTRGRGHGDRGRGRGDWGRGHGDRGRGHFSDRRGEGRHMRGRGSVDHDRFSSSRDDDRRPFKKDWDDDKHYRGRGRGGRGGDRRGGDRGSFRERGSPRGSVSGSSVDEFGRDVRGRERYCKEDIKEDLDIKDMSMSDKVQRLCAYLKSDKPSVEKNPVSIIKNAIGHTRIGLETTFESVNIGISKSTTPMYTGVLKVGPLFLARGLKPSNKELKREVFEKAVVVLKTKTIPELFCLKDPGVESAKQQLEQQLQTELQKFDEDLIKKEKSQAGKHDPEMHSVLTRIVNALLTMKNVPQSPVAVIEQAVSQSCVLISHEFQADVAKMSNGLCFFRGKLSIGSVVIGRGGDITKRKCKLEAYTNALERLKSLSVDELMESVVEIKAIPDIRCIGESAENPTLSRMKALSHALKHQRCKEDIIVQLDVAVLVKGLTPIIVYKQVEDKGEKSDQIICEYYLNQIFIVSCEGKEKQECTVRLHKEAWKVLMDANIEDIVSNNKRITDEEIKDPRHLDVVIKGKERSLESNINHLRNFGYKISECEKLDLKDLVIIEHKTWSNDRKRRAFSILNYSCYQNGLILQWEWFAVGKFHRYIFSVQKQVLGDSYGPRRNATKNLAAIDALFKLYETQDVLKIVSRPDDAQKWIPWSSIQDVADSLRDTYADEEPPIAEDQDGNPIPDKFLLTVLRDKLEQFKKRIDKGEDELIIGPGIRAVDLQKLKPIAESLKLKCETLSHDGKVYLLIYEKIPWKEIVELLKNRGRPFGRFDLVDRKELPKHEDIAINIMKKLPKDEENADSCKCSEDPEKLDEDPEKLDEDSEKIDEDYEKLDDNPENLADEKLDEDSEKLDDNPENLADEKLDEDSEKLDDNPENLADEKLDVDPEKLDENLEKIDDNPEKLADSKLNDNKNTC